MDEVTRIRMKRYYEKAKSDYEEFIKLYPFGLEDLPGEEWHDAKNGGGFYHISNFGRLKSFKGETPRILKPTINTSGYLSVHMTNVNGKATKPLVHVLVGEAFIPNPDNLPELNHIDGVKFNCHVNNLEWSTHHNNVKHAAEIGLQKSGGDAPQAKLTNEQVAYCRSVYVRGSRTFGTKALAKKFGMSGESMRLAINGERYKNVGNPIDNPEEKS